MRQNQRFYGEKKKVGAVVSVELVVAVFLKACVARRHSNSNGMQMEIRKI